MSVQIEKNPLTEYQWNRQPLAEQIVGRLVDDFLGRCPEAAMLRDRMRDETGTRFVDWVDTIVVPDDSRLRAELGEAGFAQTPEGYVNVHGIFPRIGFELSRRLTRFFIKVDSVADFTSVWQITSQNPIEGEPMSPLRRAKAFAGDAEMWVIERNGQRGLAARETSAESSRLAMRHLDEFRRRGRDFANDSDGFDDTSSLIDRAIGDLGIDWTCSLFFAAEREFWQRRNRAAQVQYARQQKLGLGWANHDHHTYRCSRENFTKLVAMWEKLGFVCRERFYAGREAGWGAQVMEQPQAGIVTFNDVDLTPEELMNDFAHEPLPPRDKLGTVGLWCGLHGDSFLQAGMHHLECQFDFEALRQQLEQEHGVRVMKPFTDFPYLRQAFTEGERWPVDPRRIEGLLSKGLITPEQAQQFREHGAIGSHLENLERNEGFKGFNQTGVSEIISATDPRKHLHGA